MYRLFNLLLLISLVLSMIGCASVGDLSSSDLPKQMVSRQILVTLPDRLQPNWQTIKEELAKTHKIQETGEFPLTSIGVDCLVYKVPDHQSLPETIRLLEGDNRIGLVQENRIFEGIQGGEGDELAALSYGPQMIRADAAHRVATGKGVKIAVIDTGVEKSHPDLKDQVKHSANFVGGGDRSFSRDTHGTAVTGVIAARADDGYGIYGIAPDAEISAYKACWYPENGQGKAQCSSWSLAKAVDAAINQGVNVINLSLAGPNDNLLTRLLETAHQRNITIVAATLEKQDRPGFPADQPTTIPVISASPDGVGQLPTWLHDYPDTVAAPGVDILTTVPKEGYDFVSGSSLATAHVSGLIALLLEIRPELKPGEIKNLLRANGSDKSGLSVLDICAIIKGIHQGDGC